VPKRAGEWLVLLRAAVVVVAALTVSFTDFPSGRETWAWVVVGWFALWTVSSGVVAQTQLDRRAREWARALAIVFDGVTAIAFIALFAYQPAEPYRALYLIPIAEAALRFGFAGGLIGGAVMVGSTIAIDAVESSNPWRSVTVRILVGMLAGLVIGRLRDSLAVERRNAEARAAEAERLRDAFGKRVDVLEAANRCARALGSALDVDQAFGAFIRELQGLIPFERTAIVLVENDAAHTIATAGRGASTVFPPGSAGPLHGSVLERVLEGDVVVRSDLAADDFPEDSHLVALGLRSELITPLLLGAQPIGMLSLSRTEVDAFNLDEIELASLLGRLVATAVQNIPAYEAEHQTVEELRRLSALRADFVSLVSHELRSPMAAVIGAARTLQDRWRTLSPEHREAFLALIGDETNRLAALIGDVLDTSRIEAGTFSYTFTDVDLDRLVEDAVATAAIGQDAVRLRSAVAGPLPRIRGDRERLRQVLSNLIDNAVKYSPEGDEVEISARRENGVVEIAVRDHGPGIAYDQQRLIFEKFGRGEASGSKPGTGLGLFIARSIAEAHGGTLDVRSRPDAGAVFVLSLPIERS
jgi:signal transduction histidine kinase